LVFYGTEIAFDQEHAFSACPKSFSGQISGSDCPAKIMPKKPKLDR